MQPMSSEAPDFRLEDFLPYRLSVAANRVSRRFAGRYGAAFGLSIPEWRVMAVLGRFGRLPAREIAARTEQYWCPIKHARRLYGAHDRYPAFFEHGDAEAFRQGLERLRRQYDDGSHATPDAGQPPPDGR